MKFVKGVLLGSIISTGVMMAMSDNTGSKMLRKKGKRLIKRMGIM